MAIVGVRIDDRLIHGQVCGYWIPHYNVERILVVDNEVCNDEARKTALKFGCPQNCKCSVFDTTKAADKLGRKIDEGIRVMLLAQGPQAFLELVQKGYGLNEICIGNMSTKPGAVQVKKTVYITEEDKQAFLELSRLGVKLYLQEKPTDNKENLMNLIK